MYFFVANGKILRKSEFFLNGCHRYFSACPTGQVRYGDHCYQASLSTETDIITNSETCLNMMSFLWFPETSLEMTFVAANFPTTTSKYHLGITQYHSTYGIFHSDNSFGTGVPFYTCEAFLSGISVEQYYLLHAHWSDLLHQTKR